MSDNIHKLCTIYFVIERPFDPPEPQISQCRKQNLWINYFA